MEDIRTSAVEPAPVEASAPATVAADAATPGGLQLVACPECGAAAEVEWADEVASTSGPLELVKIRCLDRHWFLMPGAGLAPR